MKLANYSRSLKTLANLSKGANGKACGYEVFLAIHAVGNGLVTVKTANGNGKVDKDFKNEIVALGLATGDTAKIDDNGDVVIGKNGKVELVRGTVQQNCSKYGVIGTAILADYPSLLSESDEDIATIVALWMAERGYTSVADMYGKQAPSGSKPKATPTEASVVTYVENMVIAYGLDLGKIISMLGGE